MYKGPEARGAVSMGRMERGQVAGEEGESRPAGQAMARLSWTQKFLALFLGEASGDRPERQRGLEDLAGGECLRLWNRL